MRDIGADNMIKKTLITMGILIGGCSPAIAQEPIVQDHTKTIIKRVPFNYEVCSEVDVPADKTKDTILGAIIGGAIGQNITKDLPDGATAGAIIGGMIGHNNSTATGGTQTVCQLETRYDEEQVNVYSHSVIKFEHNGRVYTATFKK